MARTSQISKEKRQSILTLRHEGQSMQKNSGTLRVKKKKFLQVQSQKPSSAMTLS
jgi:hypothetical protein